MIWKAKFMGLSVEKGSQRIDFQSNLEYLVRSDIKICKKLETKARLLNLHTKPFEFMFYSGYG